MIRCARRGSKDGGQGAGEHSAPTSVQAKGAASRRVYKPVVSDWPKNKRTEKQPNFKHQKRNIKASR